MDKHNGYYSYCSRCGKKMEAIEKAVDIDQIIVSYLQSQHFPEKDKRAELLQVYESVQPNICLSPEEIKLNYSTIFHPLSEQNGFHVNMQGQDLLQIVENKYDVEIVEKEEKQEHQSENAAQIFSEINTKRTKKRYDADSETVRKLFKYVRLGEQLNLEDDQKRELISELLSDLEENKKETILDADILLSSEKTDRDGTVYRNFVLRVDGESIYTSPMVCPCCSKKMHFSEGLYKEYVVVMLGSARVGKTAYLAALEDILYKNLLRGVSTVADKATLEFRTRIVEPYRKCIAIEKTNVTDNKTIATYIRQFTVGQGEENQKTILVKFIDMPGEAWGNDDNDFVLNKRRICKYASVFWLCVAPVQVNPDLEIYMEKGEDSDRVNKDFTEIWMNMCERFEYMFTEDADIRKIPMAVIVTRSDELCDPSQDNPNFRPQWSVLPQGAKKTPFQEKFMKEKGGKLYLRKMPFLQQQEQILKVIRDGHVLAELVEQFDRRNYFAVSAYGKTAITPEEAKTQQKVPEPSLIELPFLWTLAHFNDMVGVLREEYIVQPKQGLLAKLFGKEEKDEKRDIKDVEIEVSEIYSKE